jgi:hypothetical protein
MAFRISKLLNHGTANPVVARLTLQIVEILRKCAIAKDQQDGIAEVYVHSLVKKLLRCGEIEERFGSKFNSAVAS